MVDEHWDCFAILNVWDCPSLMSYSALNVASFGNIETRNLQKNWENCRQNQRFETKLQSLEIAQNITIEIPMCLVIDDAPKATGLGIVLRSPWEYTNLITSSKIIHTHTHHTSYGGGGVSFHNFKFLKVLELRIKWPSNVCVQSLFFRTCWYHMAHCAFHVSYRYWSNIQDFQQNY